MFVVIAVVFFFFKQKTAYEMRISDWSSDVCSSDLDQSEDSLAIALEFSQPLVGTQDFDELVGFTEAMAKPSSWSLDDSGKILRYPHVSPNQDFTVKVSGELLAADGTRLGRAVEIGRASCRERVCQYV